MGAAKCRKSPELSSHHRVMEDFIPGHVICAELITVRLSCLNGFTLLGALRSPANTGIKWVYACCGSLALAVGLETFPSL